MDEDRKYKQRGYMNSASAEPRETDRPRAPRPKQSLDVTGPRLPRLVQSVVASRCYNCSTTLPEGVNFAGACPKCECDLHCCKQCAYFESSTRFQCRKSIPERIPTKDKANDCELFSPRVTVARDVKAPAAPVLAPRANGSSVSPRSESALAPRSASDARAAFDSLFKK